MTQEGTRISKVVQVCSVVYNCTCFQDYKNKEKRDWKPRGSLVRVDEGRGRQSLHQVPQLTPSTQAASVFPREPPYSLNLEGAGWRSTAFHHEERRWEGAAGGEENGPHLCLQPQDFLTFPWRALLRRPGPGPEHICLLATYFLLESALRGGGKREGREAVPNSSSSSQSLQPHASLLLLPHRSLFRATPWCRNWPPCIHHSTVTPFHVVQVKMFRNVSKEGEGHGIGTSLERQGSVAVKRLWN